MSSVVLLNKLFCAVDLCTLLLGEANSEKDTTALRENEWFPTQKTRLRCSLQHFALNKNLWYEPVRLYHDAGSIVFWKSSQRTFPFWNAEVVFFGGVFRQVEAKSVRRKKRVRYVDAGPATQDYLFTVNVCKAIHALQLRWSTQMHRHIQTRQSGNTRSTCLHEMCIDCTWG